MLRLSDYGATWDGPAELQGPRPAYQAPDTTEDVVLHPAHVSRPHPADLYQGSSAPDEYAEARGTGHAGEGDDGAVAQ